MTITQLHYVLAVAEFRNFTKAAEKVFVTQPTLSMQVQKFEEELGVKVFDRTKKPIHITEVGQKIVTQAKNIVNESIRINDIIDQQKGFIGGEFKLGIIPTVMPTLLPMFLNNFINKYPKVKLRIEEYHTAEIVEHLSDGTLDAAIAATPLEEDDIIEKPLYYEPFVGYIPDDHELSQLQYLQKDLIADKKVLLLEDGHCFKNNILNLCKSDFSFSEDKFQLESGSFETLIKLADEGLGMTLLPYLHSLNINEKAKKNIISFNKPEPAREVSLIYHDSELKIHIIEALKDLILSIVEGAIAFEDVEIISPVEKEKQKEPKISIEQLR
ncbi:MAG: LysR substrate-binding domain-containing protein [Psychroflexus sp.]|jgi:LysR family hydrogen peroxide-inducible transcriptional activator|nr:LysR substrate-binding domain-containing protein [Psychroflexus sp.]MDR9449081.1 LysR substrate-binding domain-containing protein [Psychroflexus sp.]